MQWKTFDAILLHMKPGLNSFGCGYGGIIILEYGNIMENSVCTIGCTWSCEMASYTMAIIWQCRAIMALNDSHEMDAHTIKDPPKFSSCHKTLSVKGILWLSPNVNPSGRRKMMKDDSSDHITFFIAQASTFCAPYSSWCSFFFSFDYKQFLNCNLAINSLFAKRVTKSLCWVWVTQWQLCSVVIFEATY